MRFTRPQIEDLRSWARGYFGGHKVALTIVVDTVGHKTQLGTLGRHPDNCTLYIDVHTRGTSTQEGFMQQGALEVRIEGGKAVHVRRADSIDAGHALTDACWFPVAVLPTVDAGARALAMWEGA